jgi:hypothetical protein
MATLNSPPGTESAGSREVPAPQAPLLLLRRLRHTSPDELAGRLRAAVRKRGDEARYALGLPLAPRQALPRTIALPVPWNDDADVATIVGRLRAEYPDYVSGIVDAADAVCEHRFSIFGRDCRFERDVPWTADPVSWEPWPKRFHTRLRVLGSDTAADVKYVWELNRHQFLPRLAKAAWLTGDDRYAVEAAYLLDGWIRENPYKVGVNWTSALEVALRALSWLWACGLLGKRLEQELLRCVYASLLEHGSYIDEHLSFHSSPYNHLIGEATALFALGMMLKDAPQAERWRERGWKVLTREIRRQFHEDGGTVEQATSYHYFTLGFYLQAVLIARRHGRAISPRVWDRLERAFEFAMHLTRPDGSTPMIGDADEGQAFDLMRPSLWDFRPLLALGALLFNRTDLQRVAGPFPPDAAWMIDSRAWRRYEGMMPANPSELSVALPDSGYCVMRSDWDPQAHFALLDCGPIAAGVRSDDIASAAHGHADALAIEVAPHGTPVLIDPGFCTYNGEPEWHRYFRETAAHNALVVDGGSQATFAGRLRWSNAPAVCLEDWVSTGVLEYAAGSHTGYTRLPEGVWHRRALIFARPDYWIVRDELIGEGEHDVDRYFHFAPVLIEPDGALPGVHAVSAAGPGLSVLPLERAAQRLLIEGGEQPDQGWIAPGYERRLQAPVLKAGMRVRLPIAIHTLLVPYRLTPLPVHVHRIEQAASDLGDLAAAIEVEIDGGRDLWLFGACGAMDRNAIPAWTDAAAACIRFDRGERPRSCALIRGSALRYGTDELVALERPRSWAVRLLGGRKPYAAAGPPVVLSRPSESR